MACQKETDAAFPRLSTTRDRVNHYLRFGACTGDDLKDVYAQFGLTFSHGCNVEAILANVIHASDFVKNVVAESRNAGKPIYTKDECGRRFDDFLIKQHKQTMGKLVGGIEGLIELDEALEERVEDALRR